jgi:hypothetical protein
MDPEAEFGLLLREVGWSLVMSQNGQYYFANGRPETISAFIVIDKVDAPLVVRRGDERVTISSASSAKLLLIGMFRAFLRVEAVGVIPDVRPYYDEQRKLLREMIARLG